VRDTADGITGAGCPLEERESLDFFFRVKPPLGAAAGRADGTVSFFPRPNDIRSQTGAESGDLNGVTVAGSLMRHSGEELRADKTLRKSMAGRCKHFYCENLDKTLTCWI
jgi:hypothetical protein